MNNHLSVFIMYLSKLKIAVRLQRKVYEMKQLVQSHLKLDPRRDSVFSDSSFVFLEFTIRSFLIFCMNLGDIMGQKLT